MAVPAGKVPILQTVRAGWGFWGKALPQIALPATITALLLVPMGLSGRDGLITDTLTQFGAVLIAMLASTAYAAMLYRWAVRQEPPSGLGLRLGKDESNLLGAQVSVGFLLIVTLFAGMMIFGAVLTALAGQHGDLAVASAAGDRAGAERILAETLRGPSGLLLAGLGMGLLMLIGFLVARLVLAQPASIAEGRMRAFSTIAWTRGNGLRILVVLVLIALPVVGVSVLAGLLLAPLGAGREVQLAAALVQSLLATFLVLPANVGAVSHLLVGLRPPAA